MPNTRLADESIAALYTAAVDPGQWDAALKALTTLADARAANCFVHDVRTGAFLEYRYTGYGSNWANAYADYYHSLDLARGVLMSEPSGRMYAMHRFISNAAVARSEYYQDFYIREGLRYSCGGTRLDSDRRLILAVHRPVGHEPYDDLTIRALQRVLEHLPNVLRVRQVTAQAQGGAAMASGALDALPHAVIVVTSDRRIRYMNSAAISLLRNSTEIRVRADCLDAFSAQVAPQLAQCVRMACTPGETSDPLPIYAFDSDGRPTLEIRVAPLQAHLTSGFGPQTQPLAIVLPKHRFGNIARSNTDQRPFSLSRAEMDVATALASGLSPAEYADRAGVRISTVRSQIKAILAKTGARRIADIVALFNDYAAAHRK
jgi:DNA-binding CsgD family transcriptional regulator/PAS domain-containing protein